MVLIPDDFAHGGCACAYAYGKRSGCTNESIDSFVRIVSSPCLCFSVGIPVLLLWNVLDRVLPLSSARKILNIFLLSLTPLCALLTESTDSTKQVDARDYVRRYFLYAEHAVLQEALNIRRGWGLDASAL